MMNQNNERKKEILAEIHKAMQQKTKRGGNIKEDIVKENRVLALLCHDYHMEPRDCAKKMNILYGYDMTGNDVIQVLRNRRLSKPAERAMLLKWAEEVSEFFMEAFDGKEEAFKKFEEKRRESVLQGGRKHDIQERLVAIMIYEKYTTMNIYHDREELHSLGNTLARYVFYDMSDSVANVYDFQQLRESKRKESSTIAEKTISYDQAMRRMSQLENTLERTNMMLQELQDEFEEELESSRVKELVDFFSKLNSEKYGCILDELLVVKRGVDQLRKENYEIPIEINGLLIVIKKLIQFIRDSHIEPMMRIHSIREVIATDIEFCNYEGTPFQNADEIKKVRVVSPGWIYKDKEIQISRPKVREEK